MIAGCPATPIYYLSCNGGKPPATSLTDPPHQVHRRPGRMPGPPLLCVGGALLLLFSLLMLQTLRAALPPAQSSPTPRLLLPPLQPQLPRGCLAAPAAPLLPHRPAQHRVLHTAEHTSATTMGSAQRTSATTMGSAASARAWCLSSSSAQLSAPPPPSGQLSTQLSAPLPPSALPQPWPRGACPPPPAAPAPRPGTIGHGRAAPPARTPRPGPPQGPSLEPAHGKSSNNKSSVAEQVHVQARERSASKGGGSPRTTTGCFT